MKCCKSYCCKNKINSSYIKWLVELLAPVLMDSKPAEIISIPNYDLNKKNKLYEISKYFSECKKINFFIIDKKNKSIKILFVNKIALEKTLKCKKSLNFLKFLGYPIEINVDLYISYLIDKLNTEIFPDEIGIFLGYPIKDVVGFMGYGNEKSYNTKYWRVYGDSKPSEDIFSKFLYHREKMRNLLNFHSIEEILDNLDAV